MQVIRRGINGTGLLGNLVGVGAHVDDEGDADVVDADVVEADERRRAVA